MDDVIKIEPDHPREYTANQTKYLHCDSIFQMRILGITLDKPFFRFALVEKNQILSLKSLSYSELENVKQLYKTPFKGKIRSALSSKNLLMRSLVVAPQEAKHLEQIIAFQSGSAHFKESEVLSVPYVVSQNKKKTDILLFTAAKSGMAEHLEILEKTKLEPDFITASPLALISYIRWKIPHLQDAFIVDIGSEEWTCVDMEKGVLKKFHTIVGGIETLFEALLEDRKKTIFPKEISGIAKQIDLLQLKASLNSQLSSKLNSMRKELSRIIYSFSRSCLKPIFFTGRVDAFGGLQEFLSEPLLDYVLPNLTEEIPKDEQKYAISIGLCMSQDLKKVQFLTGVFFPKKTWKKRGIAAISLIAASLLFSIGIIGFSKSALRAKSKQMISSLHSAISSWDASLAEKVVNLKNEEEVINRWNKATLTYSKDYPYIMKSPKLSEILSWLYQHPVILETSTTNEPIVIESIRYQLEQYPKMDNPKEPTLAKIDLEFTTKSPLNARKFHEAILKKEGFVDDSEEIQWESTDSSYRISFYVKKEP